MTDYAGFKHGGTEFPLTAALTNTLLRDADPAVYFALDFYAAMISTHVGARLLAEAVAADATQIASAVEQVLPLNPEPFLLDQHMKFPLLSLYRQNGQWRLIGQRRAVDETLELAYVLPPLGAAQAERVLPILKAVSALLDNRTEQGFDPTYTPPGGTAGAKVWSAAFAGLAAIEIQRVAYGGYQATPDLFFPAVVMTLRMTERSETVPGDFEVFAGADIAIDQKEHDGTEIANVVQVEMHPAPTVASVTPSTGSKSGGTPVTVTGTNFRVGTPVRVYFGGALASSAVVTSATAISCVTPEHAAYPTYAADVRVVADDGQSHTLTTGFTFTTP